jgi:protein-S-isoprenylcysteine O-methyltransferase Ste14
MDQVALWLWIVYGLLAVVLPITVQMRRTGSSGFKGMRGRPGSPEWFAGFGLSIAIALAVAASRLAKSGDVEPVDSLDTDAVHAIGIALFVLGLGVTVFSQQWMGRSWRIGVDESERTELVTHGPFAYVRNPIYAGMITALLGNLLMIPSWVSLAALALLIASLEVQTRIVEEPYLLRVHGDAYRDYTRRVGRFAPGLGRL